MIARIALLFALACASGCASVGNGMRTTYQLEARATDPAIDRIARQEAMSELLDRRDRPIASDLLTIGERLLLDGRLGADKREATKTGEVAIEVMDALVTLGDRSAAVLTMRLGERDSELVRSREALEALSHHEDPVVRELCFGRMRR